MYQLTTKHFDELLQKVRKSDEDWVPPARLLCLDPGETTGWAVFDRGVFAQAGQLNTKPDVYTQTVPQFLQTIQPTHIIMENYKVYAHKLKDHSWSSLHTSQLIGSIKMLSSMQNIGVSLQMASQAKGFCTDEKLRKWGMYQTGLKHARDAIRHGCYFLLFHKENDYR